VVNLRELLNGLADGDLSPGEVEDEIRDHIEKTIAIAKSKVEAREASDGLAKMGESARLSNGLRAAIEIAESYMPDGGDMSQFAREEIDALKELL
jgi:hypothetical protein